MRLTRPPSCICFLVAGLFAASSCAPGDELEDAGVRGPETPAGDAGPTDAGSDPDGGGDPDGGDPDGPPTVVEASPAYAASEVSLVAVVELTFSTPMDVALTEAAFAMDSEEGEPVLGGFAWRDGERTLVFTPSAALSPGVTYTFVVDEGAADAEGVPLEQRFESYFTTAVDEVSLDAIWDDFAWDVDLWQ